MNKTLLKLISVLLAFCLVGVPVVNAATAPTEPETEDVGDAFDQALEEALNEADDSLLFFIQLLENSGLPAVFVKNLVDTLNKYLDDSSLRELLETPEEGAELTDEQQLVQTVITLAKTIMHIVQIIYDFVKTMQSIGDAFSDDSFFGTEPVTEPVAEPVADPA